MKNLLLYGILSSAVLMSCATRKLQMSQAHSDIAPDTKADKVFYIVGNASEKESEGVLEVLQQKVSNDISEKKYLLFIGDNVNGATEAAVKKDIDRQLAITRKEIDSTFFIPGNYDWEFDGVKGLKMMEDYLEEQLKDQGTLVPKKGCPLESIEISEDVQLIVVDSQWYLEDWDRSHKMNDNCEIKTRKKLLLEIEGEIQKYAHKVILFALHHPLYTNGAHGGRFSFRDHIFPFRGNIPAPVLASFIAEIRSQGAVTLQDRFNRRYYEFMNSLLPLLNNEEHRIIVISGHEQNLQYIEEEHIKQLISGSGAKTLPASIRDNGLFSYGRKGFATISVHEDKSVWASFYGIVSETALFQKKVYNPLPELQLDTLPTTFPKTYTASVYDLEKVEKSDFFESLWGKHYRHVYGTQVIAPTALLDTLYGGLKVVRPGGGNQTKSLRLITEDGREYNMRGLKKSAVQFLEKKTIKGIDGEKFFTNTISEDIIQDFYTAAHPYGAFAIPEIAKAAGVYYTTPELFYVPKQRALGKYNNDYGDQLFMIVERPSEAYGDYKNFGYPDNIESTDDLLDKLRKDEDFILDEAAYIRARIFDMLVGDWDRHSDQWRWAQFDNKEGKTVFVPIPRDRDQVFANFDGSLLNLIRSFIGSAHQLGVYGEDIADVEWFNIAGSKLDRALVKRSGKEVWIEQAKILQKSIGSETLDRAFASLPEAVQDSTIAGIKEKFIKRKENLVDIVDRYFQSFIAFQVLTGTDKDDFFEIERQPGGKTRIRAYRIKDGEKGHLLFDRTFDIAETEEVWLYGLNDKDVFRATGDRGKHLLIRIVGGQESDTYDLENGTAIKVYDRRSEEQEIIEKGGATFRFTNFYHANTYDYEKKKTTNGGVQFVMGYNPDHGMTLHTGFRKDINEFIENPYGRRTELYLDYHFLTSGMDIRFNKGYAAIFSDFNFIVNTRFTSNNYTENFFGIGNETTNPDGHLTLNYNRVNLSIYEVAPGIETQSDYGNFFQLKYDLKSVAVEGRTTNFIGMYDPQLFEKRSWFGIPNGTYRYKNFDEEEFPTKGMLFSATLGAIDALDGTTLTGFVKGNLMFYNALLESRKLVLKTQARTFLTTGEQPTFYNSPTLGADTGLRGYRQQRFAGKHSFSGSTDLAYKFNSIRNFFFPISLSIYGGYDIGRVWVTDESSSTWHNSYGGGLVFQWTKALQGTFSAFTGDEGTRISFRFGLGF